MRIIKKVMFMVDSATPAVDVLAVIDSGAVAAGYTVETWTNTNNVDFDFYRKIEKV